MKPRHNRSFQYSFSLALYIATTGLGSAADLDWEGDVSSDFQDGTNWEGNSLPNFGTDILRFKNNSAPATVTNVNVTLTNTGTAAGTSLSQILFEGSAPAFTLGSTSNTITLGTAASNTYNNAIVLSSASTVTQTIASNIVIDDGKAYTASVVNSSTTGGLLKFTGNITGGSGAGTPGAITFTFGNTGTHNGNYEVTGNITAGGATSINLTKRGSGVLTLSGTNTLGNGSSAGLGQNEASSTIRITGGTTTLNNGADSNWGGNNIAGAGLSPVVRVSGGILNAQSARNIRSSLLVDGGTLNIGATGGTTGRLSFDATNGNKSFELSSGAVHYLNDSTSGTNQGVRLGNDSGANATGTSYAFAGVQTGGTFTIHGRGALNQTFNLGTATGGFANSYSLSGGTLDIRGSVTTSVADNNAHMLLGADTGGTGSAVFTLSSSGKLIVRSNGAQGISGAQAGAVQVLDLQGGTLVAGRIDATNLRGSVAGSNGTIVNNGTNIAPGDIGTVGRTSVVGNMNVTTGTMTIDLGGLTASSVWQEATVGSGKFDNVFISGNLSLGGTLGLNLVDAYTPDFTDVFKIIDIGGTLTNFFANVSNGGTLATIGNEGTFKVYSSGNDVFLSEFTVIPEPRAGLLGGLGMLMLLRRRRS
jgi:hypothetical protein